MVDAARSVPALSGLYERWERQHWNAHAIDFSRDRDDWVGLSDEERRRWYFLAGFSHFRAVETHAVVCLAMLLPCLRRADHQRLLGAQIADESRHAYFFERFHEEVLSAALPGAVKVQSGISPAYQALSIDGVTQVVEHAVTERSAESLGAAVLHIFIILEGSIALASFSVIRRLLTKTGLFPGLLAGMKHAHQDEVRHVELGISILQDVLAQKPSVRAALLAYLDKLLPRFSEVLEPQAERKMILEALGLNPYERRQKAFDLLRRHLRTLDLESGLIERWAGSSIRNDSASGEILERTHA